MAKAIRIRKGSDIRLLGVADKTLENPARTDLYAVKPTDFHGLTPKLVAREGDRVKAGDVLFFDKYNDSIKYNAPVSGTVDEVVRGEKRRILEVRIKADAQNEFKDFGAKSASSMSATDLRAHLLEGGCWPLIQQRPFAIVANPESTPKSIFVAGFDSSPLAPDGDFVMEGEADNFKEGLAALKVLADGKPVHLGVRPDSKAFNGVDAQVHHVSGPHPAGNPGVQIHHIDPINKGEVVWTIAAQDVANIGRFLRTGKFDMQRVVALTGAQVNQPKYYRVTVGANVSSMLKGQIKDDNTRVISGNVLTGDHITTDGFLGYYHHQITAIPEGKEPKFMLTDGWLSPGLKKFSLSHAYPTWLMPKSKRFNLDTNSNGEDRAFVVTGQYEKVFPFDIYPVQLVKSIIVNDIDSMEKLGIYEVAPEDFALCEYACTSKIEVQDIVREGLDTIMKEFS
ncbi:MAG: Na(+)-translocating NADH-quinone reductase subunit A [Flavobacteriales bacterium]|nr:Na(+)-translocating NADH-quinone reductase subunit A [Flavobacteriales bacterium]